MSLSSRVTPFMVASFHGLAGCTDKSSLGMPLQGFRIRVRVESRTSRRPSNWTPLSLLVHEIGLATLRQARRPPECTTAVGPRAPLVASAPFARPEIHCAPPELLHGSATPPESLANHSGNPLPGRCPPAHCVWRRRSARSRSTIVPPRSLRLLLDILDPTM